MGAPNHAGKDFDVIVYGASGYTGRLVAEYLDQRYGDDDSVSWAMAGRNEDKLKAVRDEIEIDPSTPLVIADGGDVKSLEDMAARAKVVLTTVGPYQLYGDDLVRVCAEKGADYVDLCGEPGWMRNMIDAHEATAKSSGARIVFSCGFDSVPFDLGVYYLQQKAKAETGAPCKDVQTVVRKMVGKFSGGTAASLKATMAAAFKDPALVAILKSPFALTPGFDGPKQPSSSKPRYYEPLDTWLAPFVMAPINTKNVHRSNYLLGHSYGDDFTYAEMMMTGGGEDGEKRAAAVAQDNSLMSDDGPKPGEGPTKEEREAGHYDALMVGQTADGQEFRACVTGDRDPGYGSTSKMIAESALCLVADRPETPGGVWTSAPAMGDALVERLIKNAGLTFSYE